MRKTSLFFAALLCWAQICAPTAHAATRSQESVKRNQESVTRTATVQSRNTTTPRAATTNVVSRSTATQPRAAQISNRTRTTRISNQPPGPKGVMAISNRAAATTTPIQTRVGAEYDQCKTAYFSCMDQYCALKNDSFRRCSCSDRVYEMETQRDTLNNANEQLTVFTENLDTVGMRASQATAMRTASEGENALTDDGSASKALLTAIMNSIRGDDATVAGKYAGLNSINMSFDPTNAFGIVDAAQAIASYNGANLYSSIYGQCRNAVMSDCNEASLQRAVTAYIMAIEQDCNTVQTSIAENRKTMKAAVREGGAMLDLARVENRRAHNSDDMAACLANVEIAVQSEEVCGANYHKCLDNGEFIDITTGAPIAGVVNFYELENILTFNDGRELEKQQLSKISDNQNFVRNFERRVKKFAEPALDKCTEDASIVWADYLDKAMLEIFYAQKSKVSEIRQNCFDFVSACYTNNSDAIKVALAGLTSEAATPIIPGAIALTSATCDEYVQSCDLMFGENIVKEYIDGMNKTDTLDSCRTVLNQCFTKYGGKNFENFFYPASGLFDTGRAADWFSLYCTDCCTDENPVGHSVNGKCYMSECAVQLTQIDSCKDPADIEKVFGGFDRIMVTSSEDDNILTHVTSSETIAYGLIDTTNDTVTSRQLRTNGVASEIYNQITDILSINCRNLQGRFISVQNIDTKKYNGSNIAPNDRCLTNLGNTTYNTGIGEDMCPRDYRLNVDTLSWGICSCWENGGRRSRWGTATSCQAVLPTSEISDGKMCKGFTPAEPDYPYTIQNDANGKPIKHELYWCNQNFLSESNQVCPINADKDTCGIPTPNDAPPIGN